MDTTPWRAAPPTSSRSGPPPTTTTNSIAAHRDRLLEEVKTLHREKKALSRENANLKRELASTSAQLDEAVLENAALRRRQSAAAPAVLDEPVAAAAAVQRASDAARNRRPAAPPRPAAPAATGFGLAAPAAKPAKRAATGRLEGLARPAARPRAAGGALAKLQSNPLAKKLGTAEGMHGLMDGLYLKSVWNASLAKDFARALVDDVWRGAAPKTAALHGSLEMAAWKSLQPPAAAAAWDRDRDFAPHPFDTGEDRPTGAPGLGLHERSMREAKVTLRKWRHARSGAALPCPLRVDGVVFLHQLAAHLDGKGLAKLEAVCRYFWVPRGDALADDHGPCELAARYNLVRLSARPALLPVADFSTKTHCAAWQFRCDLGRKLARLRARNAYGRAVAAWKARVVAARQEEKDAALAAELAEAEERELQEERDREDAARRAAEAAARVEEDDDDKVAYRPGEIIARLADAARDEMGADRPSRWPDAERPAPKKRARVVAARPAPPPKKFFPLFAPKK